MNQAVFRQIAYGLYVVCSKKDDRSNGQIANTVFQVTNEPQTIAVSINKRNLTHEFIKESGVFTVSVLSEETPMKFIGLFGFKSGRDIDKLKNVSHKAGATGAPVVLENSIGCLEAEVINNVDVGTHTIFVGKVIGAEVIGGGEPMTYAYYHKVKGGKAPKSAPTYVKEKAEPGGNAMDKYRCLVCEYIYEPEKGDPDNKISPGTPFEKLPDNWVCPVCGAAKDQFEKAA